MKPKPKATRAYLHVRMGKRRITWLKRNTWSQRKQSRQSRDAPPPISSLSDLKLSSALYWRFAWMKSSADIEALCTNTRTRSKVITDWLPTDLDSTPYMAICPWHELDAKSWRHAELDGPASGGWHSDVTNGNSMTCSNATSQEPFSKSAHCAEFILHYWIVFSLMLR